MGDHDCPHSHCQIGFASWAGLDAHLRYHHGKWDDVSVLDEKPYQCHFCPMTWHTLTGRKNHEYKDHKEEVLKAGNKGPDAESKPASAPAVTPEKKGFHLHECEVCHLSYSGPKALQKHQEMEHGVMAKPVPKVTQTSWNCYPCDLTFNSQQALATHYDTASAHNKEKSVGVPDGLGKDPLEQGIGPAKFGYQHSAAVTTCNSCMAEVKETNQVKHDLWHKKLEEATTPAHPVLPFASNETNSSVAFLQGAVPMLKDRIEGAEAQIAKNEKLMVTTAGVGILKSGHILMIDQSWLNGVIQMEITKALTQVAKGDNPKLKLQIEETVTAEVTKALSKWMEEV